MINSRITDIMTMAFTFLLVFLLGLSQTARAERPTTNNVNEFIASLGPIGFSEAGGVFLPRPVLEAQRKRKISPILMLVLQNHMLASAVKSILRRVPGRLAPYVELKAFHEQAMCRLQSAFSFAMLFDLLANGGFGNSPNNEAGEGGPNPGLAMAQAFGKNKCGDGGGEGFDPLILLMFQGKI